MLRTGRLPSSRVLLAAFACTAIVAGAPRAHAEVITIPVGSNVSGNGQGSAPFSNVGDTDGNRYQQIYSSLFFSGGAASQSILDVAFRPKQGAFLTFIGSSLTVSNLTVRLSTTPRTPDTDFPTGLSADLDLNVGADAQTVFQGPITLTTDRLFGDTDVEDFDYRILFQNPFLYRPALGNLLLEVIIPAGAAVSSNGRNFPQLDSFTDAFPSRDGTASATDANLRDGLSVGSNSTTGAVTQFRTATVPEPATLALLAMGSALVVARRRKK